MLERLKHVSLQTKITGLLLSVIILLILILSGFLASSNIHQIFSNKYKLSMQTARTVALLPSVKEALEDGEAAASLQFLTDQFSMENEADFIIIQDKDGRILTHPDPEKIGDIHRFKDGYKARVFGGYYRMESNEFIDTSIVGIAPIMSESGNVLGVATVGYVKEEIWSLIHERIEGILYFSLVVILIGAVLGYLLARHIRKESLGYEPREIAKMYKSRDTLLASLNEGVIAADEEGKVNLINRSARQLFPQKGFSVGEPIASLLPGLDYQQVYDRKQGMVNQELFIHNKPFIVNLVPILTNDQVTGLVATLRDKTEITEMLHMLSEVRRYSDDLRAQTHEYSNKMHLIYGMLQLGKYDDVLKVINQEISSMDQINRNIFEHIEDTNVQAILIGKTGRASEKKVDFVIDPDSYLYPLPPHIEISDLMIILGNLIDNAVEEVTSKPDARVSFAATDLGEDIIFEISDNGSGLKDGMVERAFEAGYSTKKKTSKEKRGFGLANVKSALEKLDGGMEIESSSEGTTITVYLPKQPKGGIHHVEHRNR
ncbi:ATP-binding protein [Virgibacillus xinjiangensis]|uniref:histidine kinase n=1 Tax=Virgibacillus xinjiangensis TaxID=393090 RepID=A0ABV7CW94_9BACI